MAGCNIDMGSVYSCLTKSPSGILDFCEIWNLDDWRAGTPTYDPTDGHLTGYVNAQGLKAYRFEAADETNIIPLTEPRPVEGGDDGWKHGLTFPVFDRTQAMRNNVERMQSNKVVCIIMRNDGKGEILGKDGGLRLSAASPNAQDPNLGNMFQVTVETKDTMGAETKMPLLIDAGDYTTTLALIEGMEQAGA